MGPQNTFCGHATTESDQATRETCRRRGRVGLTYLFPGALSVPQAGTVLVPLHMSVLGGRCLSLSELTHIHICALSRHAIMLAHPFARYLGGGSPK